MRLMKMAALALLAVASGVVWTPAASAAGSSATCTFAAPYSISGVTLLTPTTFHYTTEGNATVFCVGSINGYPVAGPGTYSEVGYLYGTCLQGYGPVPGYGPDTYTASIPVFKNGKTVNVSLTGSYDIHYLSGLGTEVGASGTMETATWQYVLLTGNCVTTPATQVLVTQQEVIHT